MHIAKAIKDIFVAVKIVVDPYKLNLPGGEGNISWRKLEHIEKFRPEL